MLWTWKSWSIVIHGTSQGAGFAGYYWMVSPGLYWIHMCTSQALANLQRLCTTSHRVTVWYIMIQFTSVYCMLFRVVSGCFMLFHVVSCCFGAESFWRKLLSSGASPESSSCPARGNSCFSSAIHQGHSRELRAQATQAFQSLKLPPLQPLQPK